MHDLFEGVIPKILKLVITNFVKTGIFSLDFLNTKLETFPYGDLERANKPVLIHNRVLSASGKICRSASQKKCLFYILPLIIGDIIPAENLHCELLILLTEIVQIVTSPVISKHWLTYLKYKISDFCEALKELPPASFITKVHYLIHYPRLIEEYEPLIRHWCMRYEAKHQYFKNMAFKSRNFINIAKTISSRHQKLCWLQSGSNGLENDYDEGKS